ncbi:MAG: hypothetical protein RBT65_04080 [Methanolobus sp.]|nr:hypothetical protein [Methanolobus sp.]
MRSCGDDNPSREISLLGENLGKNTTTLKSVMILQQCLLMLLHP